MAGHNKWSQIKHKKAKEDAKRGQAFTKIIKEITVAAREGGGDPAGNARLRGLLEKSREINMPIENAQRAVKRGTGELPGTIYEEYTYEGYGPNGIAIVIETLTDNKNRIVADLRHIFVKNNGNLAESGAVSWMFAKKGVVRAAGSITEDTLLEKLLDFDVDDVSCQEALCSVTCDPKALSLVKDAISTEGLTVESAEIEWVPQNVVSIPDDQVNKALALLSALQDHDDVKNVYTNLA